MDTFKNFFLHIKQSVYSPSFYEELLRSPLTHSFRYFIGFAVLLALLVMVVAGIFYMPSLKAFMAELRPSVVQGFPTELVIEIKDGKASVNVAEPYFVSMPGQLASFFKKADTDALPSLIVIDTKTDFSFTQFNTYRTLAWLTKDSIVYQEEGGGLKIIPLHSQTNERIDKQTIVLVMDKIAPYFNFVAPVFLFAVFGGTIFVMGLNLLYLFLGALFIYVLARVRQVHISYKKAYQWGMHAMTLPLVVELLLIALGFKAPFLFTALMLFVIWFNLPPRGTRMPEPDVAMPPSSAPQA